MSSTEEEQNESLTPDIQLGEKPLVQSPQGDVAFQISETVHVEMTEQRAMDNDSPPDAPTLSVKVAGTITTVVEAFPDEEPATPVMVLRPRPRGKSSKQLGGADKTKRKRDESPAKPSKQPDKKDKADQGSDSKKTKTSKTK